MKVVHTGNRYDNYDDTLKVYDQYPPRCYAVRFNPKIGFWLEGYAPIKNLEEKIYGVQTAKIDKVLNAFEAFERNLGVILSGNKGIGKSLFAKMLAEKAVEKGIPVIVVDTYYKGIASYLETIDQEVMVLFDEFDKTFGEVKAEDGNSAPQTEMLTLFDGVSQGKKLYVITCNNLRSLNDYLINRPGRFHYHFRFEYPTSEEITEYLQDKLDEKYYGEISRVVQFSKRIDLNYDCLRAIVFELNTGISFEAAIADLNIINMNSQRYDLYLLFENGHEFKVRGAQVDLFDENSNINYWMADAKGDVVHVDAEIRFCKFDKESGRTIITSEGLKFYFDEEGEELEKELKGQKAVLTFIRKKEKGIHYAL